mmetsp:Transcript_31386/g.27732  ORF Transcript_31386/g.27732 Transcript_31386/m.27732 type:complete len:110 (+) Transcript_31386:119-448(+)
MKNKRLNWNLEMTGKNSKQNFSHLNYSSRNIKSQSEQRNPKLGDQNVLRWEDNDSYYESSDNSGEDFNNAGGMTNNQLGNYRNNYNSPQEMARNIMFMRNNLPKRKVRK